MSGIEILEELRKKDTGMVKMKIVVFSNLSSDEDQMEAFNAGADGFISKTEFTPSELVERVKTFLGSPSEGQRAS